MTTASAIFPYLARSSQDANVCSRSMWCLKGKLVGGVLVVEGDVVLLRAGKAASAPLVYLTRSLTASASVSDERSEVLRLLRPSLMLDAVMHTGHMSREGRRKKGRVGYSE
jgi:hypothetical protein